jgi:hypothetical protein
MIYVARVFKTGLCAAMIAVSMISLVGCSKETPVVATPQPVTPSTETNTTGGAGNQAGTSSGGGGIDQSEGIPTKR